MTCFSASHASFSDFWCSRGADESVGLGGWHVAFSKRDVELQSISMVEIGISETASLKHSQEMKWTILDGLKISLLVFWRILCSAWRIFCESSESLAVESFRFSFIVSHPVSDLSAILSDLFLFFS